MEWRKRWGIAVALVALALTPHWRSVLLQELPLPEGYLALLEPSMASQLRPTAWNALWWDSIGQFWAWRTEAMGQLSTGRLPLWSNRIGCGFPFLANPQTQSLYPPAWLVQGAEGIGQRAKQPLAMRAAKVLAWLAFFHTLLALIGAYWLIRSFGISRSAALVGASAYGLGSFQIAWVLLPTLPATSSWLPLTLFLYRQFASALFTCDRFKSVAFGIAFALSLTMLLLAGHGQIALYALLALATFAVVELLAAYPLRKGSEIAKAFAATLGLFLLAFLLSAAQLLPTLELAPLTHRHTSLSLKGYRAFAERGLTAVDWATLVLPFVFGNPMDGSYFGKESFADYCAYAGLGILALAIVWLWNWAQSNLRRFPVSPLPRFSASTKPTPFSAQALSLFALGALLASGATFNLPLYFLLPGFSQLGTPTRAMFLCQLALGMMAAAALERLAESREQGAERLGQGVRWETAVGVALAIGLPVAATVGVGLWLSGQLPAFRWDEWVTSVAGQNIGVFAGVFAVVLLTARWAFLPRSISLLRFAVPFLLLAELAWFAAQQIPTARPTVVQRTLKMADHRLRRHLEAMSLPVASASVPHRLLPLGVDWSLTRYPHTLLPPNSLLLLASNFADARNYDSLLLRHHKAVMALFSGGNPCPLENGNLILLPKERVTEAEKLARLIGADAILMPSQEKWLVRRIGAHALSPRAFLPVQVNFVHDPLNALAKLPHWSEQTALITAKPKRHFGREGDQAKVWLDKDALVFIKVQPVVLCYLHLRRPVWLVLSDTAYPGWRAFERWSDGHWQPIPIGIANGFCRASYVSEVSTEVAWVYFPASFAVGAFLTCGGVLLVVALFICALLSASPFAKVTERRPHNEMPSTQKSGC